jgi:hypothetical protein
MYVNSITHKQGKSQMDQPKNVRITRDENDHYHSQTQYISSSAIKTIAKKSVSHYLRQEPYSGPALAIGSAFHTLVLEPELFEKEYLVLGKKIDRRTKAGKAEMAAIEAEAIANNQSVVMANDHNMIQSMAKSVSENEDYQKALDNCAKEVSIYIEDFRIPGLDADLRVRVRPDAYCKDQICIGDTVYPNVVIDLKSCQDASPRGFKYAVYQFGWHIQAAFYLDLMTHVSKSLGLDEPFNNFLLLAVEKSVPYSAQMYRLSDDMIAEGRKQYQKALRMWHHYLTTNEELGYHSGDDLPQCIIEL